MAKEITLTARLRVANGNYTYDAQIPTLTLDQATAAGGNPGIVEIGTAEEDVNFGDLTDPGITLLRNLDATNSVDYGAKDPSGNMQAIGTLRPTSFAIIELATGATLRMQADTAACRVLIHAQDR